MGLYGRSVFYIGCLEKCVPRTGRLAPQCRTNSPFSRPHGRPSRPVSIWLTRETWLVQRSGRLQRARALPLDGDTAPVSNAFKVPPTRLSRPFNNPLWYRATLNGYTPLYILLSRSLHLPTHYLLYDYCLLRSRLKITKLRAHYFLTPVINSVCIRRIDCVRRPAASSLAFFYRQVLRGLTFRICATTQFCRGAPHSGER